jgi:hypothetical protein
VAELLQRSGHVCAERRCPCVMQLMSELVRKAEADIDVLRTRLAAVDAPPTTSATAQPDPLLQVLCRVSAALQPSCCRTSALR